MLIYECDLDIYLTWGNMFYSRLCVDMYQIYVVVYTVISLMVSSSDGQQTMTQTGGIQRNKYVLYLGWPHTQVLTSKDCPMISTYIYCDFALIQ